MAFEFDRGIVGQEFDRTVFDPITEQQIIDYARAYGETNPLYTDPEAAKNGPFGGIVGPPTIVFRLRGRNFMPKKLPQELGRRGFDAGKDLEVGALVRPGDVLTSATTVHDVYEKTGRSGTMVFLVLRTTVTNQRQETVAVVDQRMMFRPPGSGGRGEGE
jgi:acyl dehydratase